MSWTVKNQGAATASNDWYDAVYLSKDNVYDYSDAYLAGSNAADQSPLAAGSSYTQTKAISAPSIDTAGQYYLIFRTNPDSYSGQAEISKANNDLAIPISLDLKVPDPMVTLAVSPSAVAEDGNSNIIYTFSRTGDTSNGLSVHYALGGTATRGIDYTGIAATWTPIRSVSFAAGTASATIMVDPTVDSEIEPDESIELSLVPGYGYSIGTTAWVVGTILNAAPSTTIDLFGNTRLLNRGDGMAFVEFGPGPGPIPGMRKEISSPWNSPVGNEFSEWQMLAAETIAGNNQILLRNNTYNFLHTWTLDANWNWQSSNGADAFNSPGAWELESSFQVDANRDWIIGAPSTTIDLFGNTRLLNRGDGMAFVEFGPGPGPIPGMRKEISSPWNSPVGNEFSEWQMLAAETIAGNNQILLRNNTYNFLHTWTLDANWNWQSSNGADAFNSPGAWELESSFQVDANRDWIIGAPFWTPTPMSLP